jgi:hypothetical protein
MKKQRYMLPCGCEYLFVGKRRHMQFVYRAPACAKAYRLYESIEASYPPEPKFGEWTNPERRATMS